ncbi:MAG: carbohydrate ABC transporter permease, partial [Spirochaetaceae bacterium]|nr:carbohydrate ABC transporter permease [Spirochaetaceae bacterium]
MKKIGHQDPAWLKILIHALLITACIVTIYPILRIVTISLRPGDRLMSSSLAIIPADATFDNFRRALFEQNFFLWIWNSLVITITTAFIGLALASTSAYAISRWKFPGRNAMLIFLLGTQMIPAAMLMVPLYLLASKLGLINTYRGQ